MTILQISKSQLHPTGVRNESLCLCTGQLNVCFEPTSDSNDKGLAVGVGKLPDVTKPILTVEMIIQAMTKKG
jgi:hypothetical protein